MQGHVWKAYLVAACKNHDERKIDKGGSIFVNLFLMLQELDTVDDDDFYARFSYEVLPNAMTLPTTDDSGSMSNREAGSELHGWIILLPFLSASACPHTDMVQSRMPTASLTFQASRSHKYVCSL